VAIPLERRAIQQLGDIEPANADECGGSLVVADLSGFMRAELPPPRFVVERIIPAGTATLLGAHGGSGKSVCALTISAHVATSRPWAGFEVDGGPVVFVSLEDPAPLVLYRLRRIVTAYSLPDDLIEANLTVVDGTDGDASLGRERAPYGGERIFLPTERFEHLRGLAAGSRLVVIDNASDAFDGNENERRMVRAFVRMLARLARDHDTAVLLLAHIDKNAARHGAQGNSYSGSTAWHNSARSRLALLADGQTVQLVQEKSNLGRLAEPLTLSWSQHGVLVPSTWAAAAGTDPAEDDSEGLLKALIEAATHGVTVPDARTGSSTAQKALETLDDLPAALRGAAGRRRFWPALNRLQRDGCVKAEIYKTADRKMRSRLVVVPDAPNVCARQSPITPAHGRAQSAAPAPICANADSARIGAHGRTCARCDGEGCQLCEAAA